MASDWGVAATPDWRPPGRLPSPAATRYWKDAITLLLLIVALPWLLSNLVRNPARVLVGRGATGPA